MNDGGLAQDGEGDSFAPEENQVVTGGGGECVLSEEGRDSSAVGILVGPDQNAVFDDVARFR